MDLVKLETKWKAALTSILEELTEPELRKLLFNLDKIPQGLKADKHRQDLPYLIVQYYGTEESIIVVDREMKRIPRNDAAVQELLRPFVEKLKKVKKPARKPAADPGSVGKKQTPAADPGSVGKKQTPAADPGSVGKKQTPAADPGSVGKKQTPAADPGSVGKKQTPAADPGSVGKKQTPAADPGSVGKKQTPAADPGSVGKKQTPAADPGSVGKKQTPAADPGSVAKKQTPAADPGSVGKKQTPAPGQAKICRAVKAVPGAVVKPDLTPEPPGSKTDTVSAETGPEQRRTDIQSAVVETGRMKIIGVESSNKTNTHLVVEFNGQMRLVFATTRLLANEFIFSAEDAAGFFRETQPTVEATIEGKKITEIKQM